VVALGPAAAEFGVPLDLGDPWEQAVRSERTSALATLTIAA
jgi:hypothetical protein